MENQKIPDIIHPSWHPYLQPLFNDPKMIMINNNLLPRCRFYPKADQIFRVFQMPIDKIKVVILGQDPYFNGSANGLAFAVDRTTKIPKSLEVIRQEIIDTKVERDSHINISSDRWKELSHWTQQGVFLLNSALTVEVNQGGSHTGIWMWFIREVIKVISIQVKPVWLLWGAKAKSFNSYIMAPKIIVNNRMEEVKADGYNVILQADHPAAGSYGDSKYNFSGCNHFSICNEILKAKGQTIINW